VDQSKTVQARITKSSPSAAWKTLVSGTVKLFHKFLGNVFYHIVKFSVFVNVPQSVLVSASVFSDFMAIYKSCIIIIVILLIEFYLLKIRLRVCSLTFFGLPCAFFLSWKLIIVGEICRCETANARRILADELPWRMHQTCECPSRMKRDMAVGGSKHGSMGSRAECWVDCASQCCSSDFRPPPVALCPSCVSPAPSSSSSHIVRFTTKPSCC